VTDGTWVPVKFILQSESKLQPHKLPAYECYFYRRGKFVAWTRFQALTVKDIGQKVSAALYCCIFVISLPVDGPRFVTQACHTILTTLIYEHKYCAHIDGNIYGIPTIQNDHWFYRNDRLLFPPLITFNLIQYNPLAYTNENILHTLKLIYMEYQAFKITTGLYLCLHIASHCLTTAHNQFIHKTPLPAASGTVNSGQFRLATYMYTSNRCQQRQQVSRTE
jgi:hypothetical protein